MYWGWKPYVPVAVRRARALRKMNTLRKKGLSIEPVEIEGRKIARTFWGEAWCDHLESFSDYENRLPRGRSYLRNGSVCHLEIAEGAVKAMVHGSELYNVTVAIKKLPTRKWRDVKGCCSGQIGSLLELLEGRLSTSVMSVVTDRREGIFPLPKEISFHCSCPDWAIMCKHVAAVLYGVAARLDEKPEMLFLLRGVDHEELISADADTLAAATAGKEGGRRRVAAGDLEDVFGIEITDAQVPKNSRSRQQRKGRTSRVAKAVRSGKRKKASQPARKRSWTGKASTGERTTRTRKRAASAALMGELLMGSAVAKLRAKFGMSQNEFAQIVGVSASAVGKWEKKRGRLHLQARTREALRTVTKLSKATAWKRLNGEES